MTRDDAVIGEAAGLAMGLVMIGTRNHLTIEDMVNVSQLGSYSLSQTMSLSLVVSELF